MPSKPSRAVVSEHASLVARELGASVEQIRATSELLVSGATVPLIARYRREATGSLDEVAVAAVRNRMAQLAELDKRRDSILASLSERGLLDDELRCRIGDAVLAGARDIIAEDVSEDATVRRELR